jgi:hypothetical protein
MNGLDDHVITKRMYLLQKGWTFEWGVRADVGDKGHPYMDHAAGFALWPDPLARKNRDVIQ